MPADGDAGELGPPLARARAARRWRSEVLVDSGGLAISASCPLAPHYGGPPAVPGRRPSARRPRARQPLRDRLDDAEPGGAGVGFPARHCAVPAGAAGADRAAGRGRRGELRDRGPAGHLRGHGPQVAAPVLRAAAWAGWPTPRGPGRPRSSPPASWPRSRPWPASCPRPAASRWPAGPAPSWPARRPPAGSSRRSSASTVRRWLADDAIKPWQHRSWIFPRDPHFALKGGRVLDLYQRDLGRTAAGRRRVRAQRRREARRPGTLAHPPPAAARPAAGDAGRERVPSAAAPWPTWPPTTSTAPASSAGASRPPGSSRSPRSSTRS